MKDWNCYKCLEKQILCLDPRAEGSSKWQFSVRAMKGFPSRRKEESDHEKVQVVAIQMSIRRDD
jgi:hypothetical protein